MRWLILFGLWLCYAAFGVVVASLAPLVPVIQRDLGLSHGAIGSVMGAWQLVYIAAAIPAGVLLDRLGPRWGLSLGVALMAASALGRAAVEGYWGLLAAVMLFGLGGPIISSGAPKIVAGIFHGSQRGFAMGVYITGPAVGSMLALTLTHAALLPWLHSWRGVMVFWGVAALMGLLLWFAIASFAGPRVAGFQRDEEDNTAHESAARVVGVLLADPSVRLLLGMAVGAFMINHGLNSWLPELLRSGGLPVVQAGYWAAFPLMVGLVGALTIPRLATPPRRFRIIFALCIGAVLVCLALRFQQVEVLAPSLLVQGLVRSSMMTVLVLTLVELPAVLKRYTGTATGLFFSVAEVGGVLGPLSFGLMHDLSGGFLAGLYLLAGIAALMALGALRLARLNPIHLNS